MIHAPGRPDPPVPRLLEALGSRPEAAAAAETLVLTSGSARDSGALDAMLADWSARPGGRAIVLGAIGTHPDARSERLRMLWAIEERARASRLPVLALRLAPLLGSGSPLWLRLRSMPALPRRGRKLLEPLVESDVIETLARALAESGEWAGWCEVAGPEALTLAEMRALAETTPRLERDAGAWEPAPGEMAEQRLCDSGPWRRRFGIAPGRVTEEAPSWR